MQGIQTYSKGSSPAATHSDGRCTPAKRCIQHPRHCMSCPSCTLTCRQTCTVVSVHAHTVDVDQVACDQMRVCGLIRVPLVTEATRPPAARRAATQAGDHIGGLSTEGANVNLLVPPASTQPLLQLCTYLLCAAASCTVAHPQRGANDCRRGAGML